jgi:hypothetical protein
MKKYLALSLVLVLGIFAFGMEDNMLGNADFTAPLYTPSSIPADGNIFTNNNWSFLVNATGAGTATSGNGYFEATFFQRWSQQLGRTVIAISDDS